MVLTVLAFGPGHNATATLLRDGAIVGVVSEERFTRIKNQSGYPKHAINWLLESNGITMADVDRVAVIGEQFFNTNITHVTTSKSARSSLASLSQVYGHLEYKAGKRYGLVKKLKSPYDKYASKKSLQAFRNELKGHGIPEQKIVFVDHHTCHSYSAYYGQSKRHEKALVLTLDGEGDEASATVSVFEGLQAHEIARSPKEASLGYIYSYTTKFLGMTPLEHEYKVMGLAPYASSKDTKYYLETYKRVFEHVLHLSKKNPLVFSATVPTNRFELYLREKAVGERFDNVAGAVQHLTETLASAWVSAAIEKTGIDVVYAAGGVFMNVKMNMVLAKLPAVRELHVLPSCGDESAPIGAAYYTYIQLCNQQGQAPTLKPLSHLYLGPDYDKDVAQYIRKQRLDKKYVVQKATAKLVAKLLARGEVVARSAGAMEFGARSLGNRCIMANPSDLKYVWQINEQIKMRDFWMPFAPSVLAEREKEYIVNPKRLEAPYMILGFDSTQRARKDLRAAMHQADFTVRPQLVTKAWNPRYYEIIREFEKLTGIGGVLNTSFNLHGKPIVATPQDAVEEVFEHSGLQHLLLGDYLISKKQPSQKRKINA